MRIPPQYRDAKHSAGLTLIEVTLVIAVLLGLISVLFIGASAYKEGTNRSFCLLNISQVQKGVRAYQNMYQKEFNDSLAKEQFIGTGKLLESIPECRSGGEYAWLGKIPPLDTSYLSCSKANSNSHVPQNTSGW